MKLQIDLNYNNLVCGDCETWLPFVPSNSIDLIYIDPPFFSNKNYEVIWGNGFELRSFGDRWKGGIEHYIGWMRPKIIEAKRVLKKTGSIFLHCDKHANHYLRLLLDEIFGESNFKNEIIWCYDRWEAKSNRFQSMHDSLLFYSKTDNPIFNVLREIDCKRQKTLDRGYTTNLLKSGIRQLIVYKGNENKSNIKKLMEKDKFDRVIIKEAKGRPLKDYWLIDFIHPKSKERIGYKTQKPEALIERIIKATTNEKGIVFDFFGGGGTTAKVAADLGRRWITGDVSPVAYRVIKERLFNSGHKNFIDCNPPLTRSEWRLIDGHVFARRVCEYMGWEVNIKKSGDGGIDGWANNRKSVVQIKNSDVQVSVVRDLAGVCSAGNYKHGIVVGWTFSKGCYEFTAKQERKTGIKIELMQADFIVKPITNENREKYQALYAERVKAYKQKVQILEVS